MKITKRDIGRVARVVDDCIFGELVGIRGVIAAVHDDVIQLRSKDGAWECDFAPWQLQLELGSELCRDDDDHSG